MYVLSLTKVKITSMEVINSTDEFLNINQPAVVTIGSFDGVHLGHRKILQQLKNIANQKGGKTVLVTFDPHPRHFFNNKELCLLNTPEEKKQLLEKEGLDFLVVQKFDSRFAAYTPEHFIKKLTQNLHMKDLLLGYDHRLGKDRQGDFVYIQGLEDKYGFTTHRIEAVQLDGQNISSSLIRRQLKEGAVQTANKYLGYPYFITGKVVRGNQLGRKLGFPTANIEVENSYKLIPKQGVYLVRSVINEQPVYGMMNIGFRPTIDGKKQIKEVHFFDFENNLYDKELQISFLQRMRDEQKFSSLEALKNQLQKDEKKARKLLSKFK